MPFLLPKEKELDLRPIEQDKLSLRPVEKESLNLKPINKQTLNLKPVLIDNKPVSSIGKDEQDIWNKMTTFQKTLDILGRPGYAVKSGLAEIQKENEELFKDIPEEDVTTRIKLLSQQKPKIRNRLEALWKGFSGQERIQANQLWENQGVKGVPFLGFATEVATDPLMWSGGAGYKAITKGVGALAKPAMKGISKIPGVTEGLTLATEKIQPIASALKEMFITKTGIGKLNYLIDKHLGQREYLKGKEITFGIKTRNVIQNISSKYKRSIPDIEKEIVNLIELPETTTASVPEMQALSNTLKSHLSNILTKEMKAGVPITTLSENARGIQYFPRITTKEAQVYLKQARIGNAKIWNTKLANALRRKTEDFTLEEFNSFVKANGLESLGGRSVEQFFMKQPAYAVATRGLRSAKAITSAQFLDDVGRTFGSQVNPGYYEQLPDVVTKLNPSLKDLWFDPEVAGEISRTTIQYINPKQAQTFIKMFDSMQNLWKRWTLAPFPKYHLRNIVGNTWNNFLADVSPQNYPKAQAIQMYGKFKGKGNILEKTAIRELQGLGITTDMANDIITQAEKTGVLGRGWYGGDIETTIEQSLKGSGIIQKGMAFGSTIENNARLAHFLDRVDKAGMLKRGMSISDDVALKSASSVKKYLFDYGDLTAFEKQVMKRLMPFYTWTRKNVPLQLENIWTQPQKFALLSPMLKVRDPEELLKLKYASPQLYERLPVELQRTTNTITYVPLEGLIPAGDLVKLGTSMQDLSRGEMPDFFVELLSPYLRAPIEMKMNKSFYFENEIQKYDKETQELFRIDMPVKVKYALTTVLPQARLLNELNKLIKKQTRKENLTVGEQAFSQGLSSIYKVNLEDLKARALQGIKRKMDDLQSGDFWARRYERTKEGERIKKTYEELRGLIKEIRGY